jgi:hypothetical protein
MLRGVMRYVITDNRIDKKCERGLLDRGFEIIKLPSFDLFQEPVSAHPDMLIFIGDGKIVCHKDYFAVAESEILKISKLLGAKMILSDESIGKEYPRDVLFNAAPVGDMLICRRDALSERVAELYGEEKIINVNQGYAKCSTCMVGDKAIITADKSIAEKAQAKGIDVLVISPKGVRLDGYDCGFIGGASGSDNENVYFCGNIDLHPDGEKIKAFCEKQGKKVVSLSDAALYDYGTLMFI